MSVDFILPDLGEGIHEAQVIAVSVREGDSVRLDQTLMEVETDKAAVEIPSPQAGIIERVHIESGQTIQVGDPLVTFAGDGGDGAETGAGPVAESAEPPAGPGLTPPTTTEAAPAPRDGPVPASPAIRRLARERGIDLGLVHGTGPGGRVSREDLEQHIRSAAPGGYVVTAGEAAAPGGPVPPTATAFGATAPGQVTPHGVGGVDNWGPIVRQQLTQIRKTIAARMVRSYTQIPHVLHAETVDVTELDAFRKESRQGVLPGAEKLTLTPFIIKALVNALKRHPKFNSSLDAEAGELIFKQYYHVGMAVDTPRGLVVPVVRHVDTKSVLQLAAEYAEVAERVRAGRFTIEELRGGTFTITNIGSLGGTFFAPIINFPEVAILGVGRARPTPAVREGEIVVRTMMALCLSFDHRVCDGAEAARFLNDIGSQLESPIRLAL